MSPRNHPIPLTVALVGNPNTGKSTLFGALVGVRQRVGNYPGVTVEKTVGQMRHAGRQYELVDLPGLYSLAPRSRDEMVAVDLLLGRIGHTEHTGQSAPAAVICIVDATNLQRQLYLASQVLELGLPTVLALNMVDVAAARDIQVDVEKLEKRLGIPVVPIQANRGIGVPQLKAALANVIEGPPRRASTPLPKAFEQEAALLESLLAEVAPMAVAEKPVDDNSDREKTTVENPATRHLARRLLLDTSGTLENALPAGSDRRVHEALIEARARLAEVGCAVPAIETTSRHEWGKRILDGVVTQPGEYRPTASDRIDRVLTGRFLGTLIFAIVMVVVFQAVFAWAKPVMDLIETAVAGTGSWVESRMAEGVLRSLLVDGVLGGVGGVLVFLPQILILFFFIAILEDCGYMARAAYLMDRFMVRVGLSGKSFIPMLSSFACAIPGIMAARVIENERDRLTTILVAPLMTCSARLPVYALLIAAFVPSRKYLGGFLGLQGLVLVALYALGIVTAVIVAMLLKRTLLQAETPPFLMELPSYQWPSPRTIFHRVLQRAMLFVRCAGTLILTVSILVWAALYYPHDEQAVEGPFQTQIAQIQIQRDTLAPNDPARGPLTEELDRIDREIAGIYQRQSLLGRAGRMIEPVFRPLGWDWRIGSAVLASFPAREVVVATLGVVFNLGDEVDAETEEGFGQFKSQLRAATWDGTDRPLFNMPVAMSILVFYALCAQCTATLAVIRRETNSWRWPLFTFTYMTTLAYLGALITYQAGTWIAGLS